MMTTIINNTTEETMNKAVVNSGYRYITMIDTVFDIEAYKKYEEKVNEEMAEKFRKEIVKAGYEFPSVWVVSGSYSNYFGWECTNQPEFYSTDLDKVEDYEYNRHEGSWSDAEIFGDIEDVVSWYLASLDSDEEYDVENRHPEFISEEYSEYTPDLNFFDGVHRSRRGIELLFDRGNGNWEVAAVLSKTPLSEYSVPVMGRKAPYGAIEYLKFAIENLEG